MASRHAAPKQAELPGKLPGKGEGELKHYVRIIEMAASAKTSDDAGLLEKGERGVPRLKHHSFPWRVLLPVSVSPRLRGLILLNLVRHPRCLLHCRRPPVPPLLPLLPLNLLPLV